MVQIDIAYEGQLHTRATHGPSGCELETDAPRDNQGRGESFSPTDLVATALGTCMMTIMGITARDHDWPLEGATVRVVKGMVAEPVRRIGRLDVEFQMPAGLDAEARTALEGAARSCPVCNSLGPDVERVLTFNYPDS